MTALAPSLEAFFTDRLVDQRQRARTRSPPTADVPTAARVRLGPQRHPTERARHRPARRAAHRGVPRASRTREGKHRGDAQHRLAAIHSLFSYMALHHPEHAGSIGRVSSIPNKRTEVNLVTYLSEAEATALLAACDQRRGPADAITRCSRSRSKQGCGSPSSSGSTADVTLGRSANVHTSARDARSGAPRSSRARSRPSRPSSTSGLERQIDPLFATSTGRRLSRDAVEHRLAHHVATGADNMPVHRRKADHHAHPPSHRGDAPPARRQRHHRDRPLARPRAIATTNIYLHADMTHKQKAIDRIHRSPPNPAATGRRTPCSRSSKRSDYAEPTSAPRRPVSSPFLETSA